MTPDRQIQLLQVDARRLRNELDRAQADLTAAQADLSAAGEEIGQTQASLVIAWNQLVAVRAVILAMEWSGVVSVLGVPTLGACPACGNLQVAGHAQGCPLAAYKASVA